MKTICACCKSEYATGLSSKVCIETATVTITHGICFPCAQRMTERLVTPDPQKTEESRQLAREFAASKLRERIISIGQ